MDPMKLQKTGRLRAANRAKSATSRDVDALLSAAKARGGDRAAARDLDVEAKVAAVLRQLETRRASKA
jgi:hypothetical protein